MDQHLQLSVSKFSLERSQDRDADSFYSETIVKTTPALKASDGSLLECMANCKNLCCGGGENIVPDQSELFEKLNMDSMHNTTLSARPYTTSKVYI